MTTPKTIEMRLENWARWATAAGPRPAASMTGAICESMRRAALGNVWSGHQVRDTTDNDDAIRIEKMMRFLETEFRILLWWKYIQQQHNDFICRKMGYAARPTTIFEQKLSAAHAKIESLVDNGKSAP